MKKYLVLLASAMLAFSCSDDKGTNDDPQKPVEPTPPTEAFITLSAADYAFTQAGGTSDEIIVSSSGDWELIGDDKVFVPSAQTGKNGDKVTFTAGVNTKAEVLSEVFTFLCDGETATFTVTQSAGDELTIATKEYAAPVTGGSIFVEVKASGAFEYAIEEGASWLTKAAASASESVPAQVELVAAANDTGKARQAAVTFTLGELSVEVIVKQAQNDVLTVAEGTELSYEVGKPGQTINFSFQANFKPTVAASAEWITVGEPAAASSDEGVVTYTVRIEVAANEGEPRNGSVTLASQDDSALKLEVAIQQAGEVALPEGSVRIPDANFRTKLLSLGYIESADDEVCKLTDAGATATAMNVSNSGIADLTGIEAFTNLTNLVVFNNGGITRLDLSKNTKVTNLNVNNLVKLTYLNLGTMNLSWLDVKNLTVDTLKIVYEGTMSGEFGITGTMTVLDMSECTGSINYLNLGNTSSNRLSGTLDLHTIKDLQKVNLNGCSFLTKVVLPKEVESTVQILSQPAQVEIAYE